MERLAGFHEPVEERDDIVADGGITRAGLQSNEQVRREHVVLGGEASQQRPVHDIVNSNLHRCHVVFEQAPCKLDHMVQHGCCCGAPRPEVRLEVGQRIGLDEATNFIGVGQFVAVDRRPVTAFCVLAPVRVERRPIRLGLSFEPVALGLQRIERCQLVRDVSGQTDTTVVRAVACISRQASGAGPHGPHRARSDCNEGLVMAGLTKGRIGVWAIRLDTGAQQHRFERFLLKPGRRRDIRAVQEARRVASVEVAEVRGEGFGSGSCDDHGIDLACGCGPFVLRAGFQPSHAEHAVRPLPGPFLGTGAGPTERVEDASP